MITDFDDQEWQLSVVGPGGVAIDEVLSKPTVLLGRGNGAALGLTDASIAAEHVRIDIDEYGCWIEDLGAPGGAFVNDSRLRRQELQRGDRIRLASSPVELTVIAANGRLALRHGDAEMTLHRWVSTARVEVSGTSVSGAILEMGFAQESNERVLKWAAVFALCFHFLLFLAIIPISSLSDIEAAQRDTVVIRRYKPPEPPKPIEKRGLTRRRIARVPIPDPTADEPEVLLDVTGFEVDLDPVDEEFVVDMPVVVSPNYPANTVGMDAEGLEMPRVLQRVEPVFASDLARRGVQGKVDLEIVIDENGIVVLVRVINSSSDDELDAAAIAAVQQWTFESGTMDGEPVPVRAVVTIDFRVY